MAKWRFVECRDELGNLIATTPSFNFMLNKPTTLTAYYEEVPEYALTINTTAGGTTEPSPGSYPHIEGTIVPVTTKPDTGYNFNHWILDGITYTSDPIYVLMDGNRTLTAYFSEDEPPPPPTYKLTISSTIGGTTDPIPGIYEYDTGVVATVTAIPENGYYFNHWELDGVTKTEKTINILMNKDQTLLAVFTSTPPPKPPPETTFDKLWNSFVETLKGFGLPIPPKPPTPPLLPG